MNNLLVIKKYMTMILTLVIMLSIVTPVMAQENRAAHGGNVLTAPLQALGPTDPAELEAFLDDLLAKEMDENQIAGAAVSVVKDGKLFFTKGYGYADVENGIPVDPHQTMFLVGSVGKVFTWTAVMQLAEKGKLDLDADINTYLDFHVPDTFPQPITLRHLMTHTSGFEDRWLNSLADDESELMSARDWLTANMPRRVHPAGEAAGYSNLNAIFAGYIVERVSGQPYADYIQQHIFDPLGMAHSTARSPLPEELRPYASVGYKLVDGKLQPVPRYIAQPAVMPSGGHQMTVTDMARFMIAHLEGGAYSDEILSGARILEAATAQQMHTTLYTPDPRLLGTAYGFADLTDNGEFTLGHEGFSPPMHSQLLLLPDRHLGVFVTFNTSSTELLVKQHIGFQRAFFDHYFPAPAAAPLQPLADSAARLGRFAGFYRNASAPASTYHKAMGFLGADGVAVRAPGDGTLLLDLGGIQIRFVEVEPLYFRQADGPFAMLFREDGRGRITQMYTDIMPQFTVFKLAWYETPGFNLPLLAACLLIFLTMLPFTLARFLRGRRPAAYQKPVTRSTRLAHAVLLAVCVLNLLFAAGLVRSFKPPTVLHPPELIVKVTLAIGVLSALLTVPALVYAVRLWKDRHGGLAFRLYYTLVTLAALAFVWFLNYWDLLGWRY